MKRMMNVTLAVLAASFALVLASACSKQDFYEVPTMPGTGKPIENPTRLTVVTDEASSVTEGIVVHLLTVTGEEIEATFGTDTPVDVEAGDYIIVKVNEPLEGAAFHAPLVQLETATRAADGIVASAPDVHASHRKVTLRPNQSHEEKMALSHYTRTLTFRVTLLGIAQEALSSVAYELTGVNNAADLTRPFGDNGGSGNCTLAGHFPTPSTDAESGGLASTATARVLGLDFPAGQRLTVTATLTDGTTQTVSADVSSLLRGFYHLSAPDTIVLHALLSFGMDGVSGTIDDWTPGWDEDVEGE